MKTKIKISSLIINKLNKTLATLYQLDARKEKNPDWKIIASNIATSLYEEKPLPLLLFTCSTINSEYLFNQKNPEKYVSLSPKGNNLEADLLTTRKFYNKLKNIIPVRLIILIGNTDPFYIYSQEWSLYPLTDKKTLWKRFEIRWGKYQKNLDDWLKLSFPNINIELVSWYKLEKQWEKTTQANFQLFYSNVYKNIDSYFSEKDLTWELEKLNQNFGVGKYFENLKKPALTTLKDWVKRKFTEYAVQGFWLKQIFPFGILLQNEKPSELRTRMYQPLIKKILESRLPVLYPYGFDQAGFQ